MSPSSPPQHCPSPRELDDLELLSVGALLPIRAFNEPGSPVTLTLPPNVAAADAGAVELVDPEGLPLARVTVGGTEGWAVEPLTHAQYGPFRSHYLSPAVVRERYAGRAFVPVTDALTDVQLREIRDLGPTVLLALVGHGTPELSPVALMRATLVAAEYLDAEVVAVPLASHGDAATDHDLGLQVVANYAGLDRVHGLRDVGELPLEIAEIVDADRPGPERQGLVLFFTGLSGSGKSTLARALMDRVLEQGERTVTSLDGDVVRRNLSAGLTFSKEDRETNIRRIGWVAAEISRHHGVAVCSPIAPFDETRQQVRAMVEEAGGAFFLIHVATPLEECERRDRKGLYAKARAGEIPEFTGISSPYEEPTDADVRVDTTGRSIDDALADVLDALRDAGYLDLAPTDAAPVVSRLVADAPPISTTEVTAEPVDDPTLNVLFVCTANICRSPYMELSARAATAEDQGVMFRSAGTHGFREHPMDAVMAEALGRRGIDSAGFVSRPLSAELIEQADLVLTAEASHRTFILQDHPTAFRKVFTLGQFAQAATTHDLSGADLLTAVAERRGNADVSLDVHDPYGRGPEAAEACATQIDELLRVVVPALTGSARIGA
ncbi:adenylyl-sulfate kinase [Nocardioides sp. cx-173]|uniref:adenylyl-sulfate kinase n=1 Tax=Nocardioides sp. cx-173 TaxID=2898796 RepID=UPI001E2EF575|nr:adenylyl-sulfate kinase [Nocardioides sp. cx-173]MCD4526950.1 adenylyl-sulfate kinase [Nocardioides sp. cx-173]UGB41262.1 adenylyl-sulfate kinase [Nocardioides sp. cx-173]